MPAEEIHVGDPTVFEFTLSDSGVPVTLSGAIDVYFRRPTGTQFSVAATITDASAGEFSVTMEQDTGLDVPGPWLLQAYVTIASGTWHSDKYRFTVFPNLT